VEPRSDRGLILLFFRSFVRSFVRLPRAHVYDVMRAQLPTLELDAVFEAKEELALAVKQALAETMTVRQATTSALFLFVQPHVLVRATHHTTCLTWDLLGYLFYVIDSFSGIWISDSSNLDYRSRSGSTGQECHE